MTKRVADCQRHLITFEFERQSKIPLKTNSFDQLQREKIKDPLNQDVIHNVEAFLSQVFSFKKKISTTEELLENIDNATSELLVKTYRRRCTVKDFLSICDDDLQTRINLSTMSRDESIEEFFHYASPNIREKINQNIRNEKMENFLKKLPAELADDIQTLISVPQTNRNFMRILRNGTVKRNRVILLPGMFAVKFPEDPRNRKENIHEVCVGLQVNKIRKECPNFVWTYGAFRLYPPLDMRGYHPNQEYICCITEKVQGIPLYRYSSKKTFQELYPILFQVWMGLGVANKELGITHYDLHPGNVIVVELLEPTTIYYPWGSVVTSQLVKIIDWGRSFSWAGSPASEIHNEDIERIPIGRTIRDQNVYPRPNYFYDCYFIIERTFANYEDKEIASFLNFFGVKPSGKIYNDMSIVANKKYSWEAWLNLLLNCPSGKKYTKPFQEKKKETNTVPERKEDSHPVPVLSEAKISTFTFNQLREYLKVWRYQDIGLVVKQKIRDEKRLEILKSIRPLLTEDKPLPTPLVYKDPNQRPENFQDQFIDLRRQLAELSHSLQMKEDLEALIKIYQDRIEHLTRWLSFVGNQK